MCLNINKPPKKNGAKESISVENKIVLIGGCAALSIIDLKQMLQQVHRELNLVLRYLSLFSYTPITS